MGNEVEVTAYQKKLFCKLPQGGTYEFLVKDVLYIPEFTSFLLSLSKLVKKGFASNAINGLNGKVYITDTKCKGLRSPKEVS